MTPAIRPQSPRGFAAVFAVVLIGMIATALTAAAMLLRIDARHTAALRGDAQLRQLLLAGAADAVAHANTWHGAMTSEQWSPQLPNDSALAGDALTFQAAPAAGDVLTVHLTATHEDRQAEETLQFHRDADQWKLSRIHLGPISATPSAAHRPRAK